jgi:PAS domain S-box-containing protein
MIDSAPPRTPDDAERRGGPSSLDWLAGGGERAEDAKFRLAAIVESSDDAIISKRLDGVITSWNAGAERLFGYTAQEAVGRPIMMLMPPERVNEEAAILDRIRRGERIEHYETVRRRKDGVLLDISLTVSPITDAAGKIVGASKIARDISGRKRTEEALLRLNNELEARVEDRTRELLASKNRLRALASELNLAEQRERRRLAAELHDYLAQLLALSKIKLGQAKQHPMSEPLSASLSGVQEVMNQALAYTRSLVAQLSPPMLHEFGLPSALNWLAEQMKERDLAVVLDMKQDIGPLPEDQAVLLFQSVRELLINVSKHGRTQQATVTVTGEDGLLRIVVADQGTGFELPAVAAPEDFTAPGFGLFSIRERMLAIGGQFNILSVPEQGTTATLTLSLARSAEAKAPSSGLTETEIQSSESADNIGRISHSALSTQHSEREQRARVRVLLVDDHAMVRQGLRGLLDGYADIEVIGEAANGEEAVSLGEEGRPDVIVMDANMPIIDGIEATRRLKRIRPQTVVIGLSVDNSPYIEQAMREAGVAAFHTKEAAVEELYRTIQASMGKSAASRA